MKESNLFKSLVVTLVIIVLGGPAVVLAGTPSNFEDAKATVSHTDLNLESEEGVRALYRRLRRASKDVCGFRSGSAEAILAGHEIRRCYRDTLSYAVDKFDTEDLTRIHAG